MFRRTTKFKRGKTPQPNVDKRFQYFHHYWRIAQKANIDILFDTVRMESHPYLIEKVQYQLEHNLPKSYDKFCHFFLTHPLFDNTNIIAKKAEVQRLKSTIRTLCIQPDGSLDTSKSGPYQRNIVAIKTHFNRLSQIIVIDYNKQLSAKLIKVLSTNQPLKDNVKADIRFLVNAYMVQLYHKGYSIDYISKLNDIIFFRDVINEFPFEKKLSEFGGASAEPFVPEDVRSDTGYA